MPNLTEEEFEKRFGSKPIPLLKGEVVEDKGILTSNEIKQYSDTKQVWWIRLIKWVLKYI